MEIGENVQEGLEEILKEDDFSGPCPLQPRHGYVVGREVKVEEVRHGTIVIPGQGTVEQKFTRIKVLAVGPGRQNEFAVTGADKAGGYEPIPIEDISVGDEVFVNEYGDQKVLHKRVEYVIAEDRSIVAVLKDAEEEEAD